MSDEPASRSSLPLNLHLHFTDAENATRLFKEAQFTLSRRIFRRVVVLGLWREGLPLAEAHPTGLEIRRVETKLRVLKEHKAMRWALLRKAIAAFSVLQYLIASVVETWRLRPSHISCHNAALLPISWLASRSVGAVLIYLPHELETQRSGLTGVKQRLEQWIERLFIRSARDVVVVCEPIAEWYRSNYGLGNVHVVRNVPESSAVNMRDVPQGGFRKRFQIRDDATVFIYQGVFGPARGTDRLQEVFARLDSAKHHLVLMGYGTDSEIAEIQRNHAQYGNIHFQRAVPREWITSFSGGADVGIFISDDTALSYTYSLPNKFFEFAHAGLPMLVSSNLELQSRMIERHNLGWSVALDTIEGEIRRISELDLRPYKERVRQYAKSCIWDTEALIFYRVYHDPRACS